MSKTCFKKQLHTHFKNSLALQIARRSYSSFHYEGYKGNIIRNNYIHVSKVARGEDGRQKRGGIQHGGRHMYFQHQEYVFEASRNTYGDPVSNIQAKKPQKAEEQSPHPECMLMFVCLFCCLFGGREPQKKKTQERQGAMSSTSEMRV